MSTLLKRSRYSSRRRLALWNELIGYACGAFIIATLGFGIIVLTEACYGWP